MSHEPRRILVVAHTLTLARDLLSWLGEAGYELVVVTTFQAAKAHLTTAPDLLITELKLREYNGLHLALRAQADGVPTAVIGVSDPVFARDADQLGATYVHADTLTRDGILLLVAELVATHSPVEQEPALAHWIPALDREAETIVGVTSALGGLSFGLEKNRPLAGAAQKRHPILH